MEKDLHTDLERGFTYAGPHRADVRFMINHKPIKKVFSRGQLKILFYALLLTRIRLNQSYDANYQSLIVIDDFTAEVGLDYQRHLCEQLPELKQQVILSALEENNVIKQYSERMFHVKHGLITRQ